MLPTFETGGSRGRVDAKNLYNPLVLKYISILSPGCLVFFRAPDLRVWTDWYFVGIVLCNQEGNSRSMLEVRIDAGAGGSGRPGADNVVLAGAAVTDITSPPGLAKSGYAARLSPATGAQDPLAVCEVSAPIVLDPTWRESAAKFAFNGCGVGETYRHRAMPLAFARGAAGGAAVQQKRA